MLAKTQEHAFSVLSLLPLTSRRLSEDQATWYTAPTCPRKLATNVPSVPFQSLMALSNDALAIHLPSGENCTCRTKEKLIFCFHPPEWIDAITADVATFTCMLPCMGRARGASSRTINDQLTTGHRVTCVGNLFAKKTASWQHDQLSAFEHAGTPLGKREQDCGMAVTAAASQ